VSGQPGGRGGREDVGAKMRARRVEEKAAGAEARPVAVAPDKYGLRGWLLPRARPSESGRAGMRRGSPLRRGRLPAGPALGSPVATAASSANRHRGRGSVKNSARRRIRGR
jgi:hypothetical protein